MSFNKKASSALQLNQNRVSGAHSLVVNSTHQEINLPLPQMVQAGTCCVFMAAWLATSATPAEGRELISLCLWKTCCWSVCVGRKIRKLADGENPKVFAAVPGVNRSRWLGMTTGQHLSRIQDGGPGPQLPPVRGKLGCALSYSFNF